MCPAGWGGVKGPGLQPCAVLRRSGIFLASKGASIIESLWSQKDVRQQAGPSCLLTMTSVSLSDAPEYTRVVLLALPFFLPLLRCPSLLGGGRLPVCEILEEVTFQVTKPLALGFSGPSMDPIPALSC